MPSPETTAPEARVQHRAIPKPHTLMVNCPVCECEIFAEHPTPDNYGAWAMDGPERFQECPDCDALVEIVPIQIVEAYPNARS